LRGRSSHGWAARYGSIVDDLTVNESESTDVWCRTTKLFLPRADEPGWPIHAPAREPMRARIRNTSATAPRTPCSTGRCWSTGGLLTEIESTAEPPALPAFVVAEVEAFLRSGILAHGLILAKCSHCGWCRPVAFSCCPQREAMKSSSPDLLCFADPPRTSLQIVFYPRARR